MSHEMQNPQVSEDNLDILEIIQSQGSTPSIYTEEYFQEKRQRALHRFVASAAIGSALFLAPEVLPEHSDVSESVATVVPETSGHEIAEMAEDNENLFISAGTVALAGSFVNLTTFYFSRSRRKK